MPRVEGQTYKLNVRRFDRQSLSPEEFFLLALNKLFSCTDCVLPSQLGPLHWYGSKNHFSEGSTLGGSTVGAAPPSVATATPPSSAAGAAAQPPQVAEAALVTSSRATIPQVQEGNDIEQCPTTFERIAHAYHWPRQELAVLLVRYLSGRAIKRQSWWRTSEQLSKDLRPTLHLEVSRS